MSLAISIPLRAERRRRSRLLTVALVSVACAATAFGLVSVSRSGLLHARVVEVTGTMRLARADVLAAAGIGKRSNVPWLDEAAAERRLERLPWVGSADVSVSLPWTIRIAVTERIPAGVIDDGGSRLVVAGDGTVLGQDTGTDRLPRIRLPAAASLEGPRPGPEGAAAALGAMPEDVRDRVARVVVGVDGSLELRLDEGVLVEYGSAAFVRAKAAALERILDWSARTGRELVRVSVEAPGHPSIALAG